LIKGRLEALKAIYLVAGLIMYCSPANTLSLKERAGVRELKKNIPRIVSTPSLILTFSLRD